MHTTSNQQLNCRAAAAAAWHQRTAMVLTLTSRSKSFWMKDSSPRHLGSSHTPSPALRHALLCQRFVHAVPAAGSRRVTTPAAVCLMQYVAAAGDHDAGTLHFER